MYCIHLVCIGTLLLLFANAVFLPFAYVTIIFQAFLLAMLHNFTVLANDAPEILAVTTVNHRYKGTSDSY